MKAIFKTIFLSFLMLSAMFVSAQTEKTSLYAVDFVKTKDGQQENYLKFIAQNWAKARSFMKDKGITTSYQFLSVPPANDKNWDVLLVTEYADSAGYAKREEVFEEFSKNNKTVLIDGKSSRQMADIKFSGVYNALVTDGIWEIMLNTQNTDLDSAAVRLPLENYLKGHATGNPEFMRKAFHTEGKLIFMRDGKYSTRTFEEYIAGINGKPAPDEANRKRWIESVDVAGNMAFGKIILDYPTVRFVDYMTLLKIGGEWKIINKSFYAEPKPQPKTK